MLSPRSLLLFSSLLSANYIRSIGAVTLDVNFPKSPPERSLKNVVQDNFMGISFELNSFDTIWGTDVHHIPSAIYNYLSNVRARMTNPIRIRIGGNSLDGSTYDSQFTSQMIEVIDDSYYNAVSVKFGPVLFDVVNKVADTVGTMDVMIGLSMQNPADKNTYLPLALDAKNKLGDRLDALIIGNEPDLYAGHGTREGYSQSDYMQEFGEVVDELLDASVGTSDKSLLGGPGLCCMWDLTDLFSQGYDKFPLKYYTGQHYPQHNCDGPNDQNTNMTFFQTRSNAIEYITWEQKAVDDAAARDEPIVISEYNTVACGGSNISDTFVATLWAIDVALQSASTNYSAAYIHTREYGILYNLFDPPSRASSLPPNWRTGSPYYATLFLAELFGADGSIVVDVSNGTKFHNVTEAKQSKKPLDLEQIGVYAIYDQGSGSRGKLALINYSDRKYPVKFRLPANSSAFAYRVLAAPNIDSRTPNSTDDEYGSSSPITWAGQFVAENGELVGDQQTLDLGTPVCEENINTTSTGAGVKKNVTVTDCAYEIEVPSPGAVLVLMDPEKADVFFIGNSTVVGYISSDVSGAVGTRSASSAAVVTALCAGVLALVLGI